MPTTFLKPKFENGRRTKDTHSFDSKIHNPQEYKTHFTLVDIPPLYTMGFLSDLNDAEAELVPEKFRWAVAQCNKIRDRSCFHGGPPPRTNTANLLVPKFIQCLEFLGDVDLECMRRHANDSSRLEDLTNERYQAKVQALTEFWLLTPGHSSIDESYPRLC
jgi:hypothetical protein